MLKGALDYLTKNDHKGEERLKKDQNQWKEELLRMMISSIKVVFKTYFCYLENASTHCKCRRNEWMKLFFFASGTINICVCFIVTCYCCCKNACWNTKANLFVTLTVWCVGRYQPFLWLVMNCELNMVALHWFITTMTVVLVSCTQAHQWTNLSTAHV